MTLYEELRQQTDQLTAAEQLRLMSYLAEKVHHPRPETKQYYWHDIKGITPYPLMGEDAQVWVSRSRRMSDVVREGAGRGQENEPG